jgi:hypothetical protein
MSRPKGFKLSAEQKKRMQAGRKAAKEKAQEGIIESYKTVKVKKEDIKIIGYIKEGDSVLPVFPSEKDQYKGKMFKTAQEAKGTKK